MEYLYCQKHINHINSNMFFLAVYVKEGLPFVLDLNCTRGVTGEKEIWSITNDYFTEITIHLNLLLRIMRIQRIKSPNFHKSKVYPENSHPDNFFLNKSHLDTQYFSIILTHTILT